MTKIIPWLIWDLSSDFEALQAVTKEQKLVTGPGAGHPNVPGHFFLRFGLSSAPPRRLGRAGHVELLLLLGDVGQDRTQAFILDDRGNVWNWSFPRSEEPKRLTDSFDVVAFSFDDFLNRFLGVPANNTQDRGFKLHPLATVHRASLFIVLPARKKFSNVFID